MRDKIVKIVILGCLVMSCMLLTVPDIVKASTTSLEVGDSYKTVVAHLTDKYNSSGTYPYSFSCITKSNGAYDLHVFMGARIYAETTNGVIDDLSDVICIRGRGPYLYHVYSLDGSLKLTDVSPIKSYSGSSWTYQMELNPSTSGDILYFSTAGDVYSESTGEVVFQGTLSRLPNSPVIVETITAEMGEPILQTILGLIKLLIPLLVGWLALRKALAMLSQILRQA